MRKLPRILLLALLLPACGGGGGDDAAPGPTPESLVAGDWFLGGFECATSAPEYTSFQGSLAFDGAGAFSMSIASNTNGSIGSDSGGGSYDVGTDRSLVLSGPNPADSMTGGLRPGHDAAVVARTGAGGSPNMIVLLKRGPAASYSTASLSGDYHVAGFGTSPGPTRLRESYTGTGTFNAGSGTFTYALSMNTEGTISPWAGTLLYSVDPDGRLAMADSVVPTISFSGGVMAGGTLAICTVVTPGQEPLFLVFARKSGTVTAADVAGTAGYAGFSAAGSSNAGLVGTISFVHPGLTWSSQDTANVDGVIATGTSSGTWSVTAGGRMSLLTDDPMTLELGILEGGTVGVGATLSAAAAPQLIVAMRR